MISKPSISYQHLLASSSIATLPLILYHILEHIFLANLLFFGVLLYDYRMAPKQTRSNKKGTSPPSRKTSPNKQKGMLLNQQQKELWGSKNTFLVYKSDKEVSTGMSFEQATSMYKVLPSGAKKFCEIMTFESEAKFDSFMESFVSIDSNKEELSTDVTILDNKQDTVVVSPEKTNTAASKPRTSLADLKNRLTDSLSKPYANPKLESDKKGSP